VDHARRCGLGVGLDAAYCGLVVGLALFYLLRAVGARDLSFAIYSGYALALGLSLAARNGRGTHNLPRRTPVLSQHVPWLGVIAATALGGILVIRFLDLLERGGWTLWGMNMMVACCAMVVLFAVLIEAEWARPMLSVCSGVR